MSPWAIGPGPESPGRARRFRGTSDESASSWGVLAYTLDPRTRARVLGAGVDPVRPPPRGQEAQDSWSTTRECRPWPYSPGKAGGPRGPSHPSASRPGQLLKPTGIKTLARMARDSSSKPRRLGPGPESPGKSDRHRGPLFTVPSLPGQLVDTVCPPAQVLFSRDC